MAKPSDNTVQGLSAEMMLDFTKLEASLSKATAMMEKSIAAMNKKLASDSEKAMLKTGFWKNVGQKTAGEYGKGFRAALIPQFDRMGAATANILKRALMAPFAIAKSIVTLPLKLLTSPLAMIGGAAGAYGVGRAASSIINAGRDLQSQQVDIQKTTDLTDESIERLTNRFLSFSNATGVARAGLMGLSATAGRLGIKDVDNLARFSETFIKASTATNVTPDMAEMVLRTFNAMGEGVENVDRIMSAVNELGNNLATNEQRILSFVGTMPFVKQALKMTTAQFLGLASAASTTANEESLTGTALTNLSIAMLKAVEKPGKELLQFSRTAGMSMADFASLVRDDANEALIKFLEGVRRVGDEGGSLVEIFNNMGQDGARLVRVVTALSLITDDVRRAQRMAGDEMVRNTSLSKEFARRTATVEFQQQRVTEIFRNFFATLNNNKLNTDLFKNLADSLLKILDGKQLAIAEGFQTALERIAGLVKDLPTKIDQAGIAFKGLFTDPQYLEGVIGKIGKLLATALIEGFKALISFVAMTADVIVKPLLEAMSLGLASQFAGTPGIGGTMTAQAARGYTPAQLLAAGRAATPGAMEAAFQDWAFKNFPVLSFDEWSSGKNVRERHRGAFAEAMLKPGAFGESIIPHMSGEQREAFVAQLSRMLDDPAVRAQRAAALGETVSGRSAQAIETFEKSITESAGNLKRAIDEVVGSLRGHGTQTGAAITVAGWMAGLGSESGAGRLIANPMGAAMARFPSFMANGTGMGAGGSLQSYIDQKGRLSESQLRARTGVFKLMLSPAAAKYFELIEETDRELRMADKS